MALAERVQAQLISDLGSVHGVRQILLVGKHKQDGVAQLVLQPQARLSLPPKRTAPRLSHTHSSPKAITCI